VCHRQYYKLPLSKNTGGGDTASTFSGQHVYLQFMWEVGLPSLLWSFPPTTTFRSFSAPGCWVGATTLAFSSWRVYLQFREGFPLPLPWCSGHLPSLLHFFLLLLLIIQVFFSFFPGWGSVCPGGYADLVQGCLWEYHVPLSSPYGLRLPKQSGRWCLAVAQESSWFLHLM
jgi:hypothetical protein